MATPFVQGRLRSEKVEIDAITECAVTGRQIRLSLDSEMSFQVQSPGAGPYVFEPRVDWEHFQAPNIIHDY